MAKLTSSKAKIMLKEGSARGYELTSKQKRFFGFIAGGGKPTKFKKHSAAVEIITGNGSKSGAVYPRDLNK